MRGKAGKRLPSTAINLGQRGLLGQRQLGVQLRPQRGQDLVQQCRVEDVRRFTERPEGGPADVQALLDTLQRRGLSQTA